MEYFISSSQMKSYDQQTINEIGIPSMVLMERAALSVVEEIENKKVNLKKILVFCGSGNNGGDGFAIARLFLEKGKDVTICFCGNETSMTKETELQKKICENCGVKIITNLPEDEYTTIVDALFGIGLSRDITGKYKEVIEWINKQNVFVTAVDIPSGVNADNGTIMGSAVRADLTVTFAAKKMGQILYPGADYCGILVCKKIGISINEQKQLVSAYSRDDLCRIPERKNRSNKGTYGKVLLIAGGEGMSGAAYLAASAAYHTGCGLVRILTPSCNRVVLQTQFPEAIVTCFENDFFSETVVSECLQWADVIGIGPGIGTGNMQKNLLGYVLNNTEKPLVADADALNIIAKDKTLLPNKKGPLIITPHIGEMMRLTGIEKQKILDQIIDTAVEFAQIHHVICVLKDARTIITNGEHIMVNCSGNNGMSTGGSGDVLAGIICGLLAQGMEPYEGAALGVYLHGLAGDAAAKEKTVYAMLAGDIIQNIATVLKDKIQEDQ